MPPFTTGAFDLPGALAAKADPALIADDARHFAAITASVEHSIAETTQRLAAARRASGGSGQAAMDRDLDVHRFTAALSTLGRYGADLCLGAMIPADGSAPVYVGRVGLSDAEGAQLLVDWRTPVAEAYFAATHVASMGLASRRRYRWRAGCVVDYWDEVFTTENMAGRAGLDEQSAFIASLGAARSPQMREVLATIAADQDAIVRAPSPGALVVDGGPGTGKTVVALHRCAYLLYADPRLGHRRGGVLFIGPHQPYLAYVSDVLPSLGEEGVQVATLSDLVAQGATAALEADPRVAQLKSTAAMVGAIEPAVALYEEPPTQGVEVITPWGQAWIGAHDWSRAFDAVEAGTPHNEAREQVWDELVAIVAEQHEDDAPPEALGRFLRAESEVRAALHRAWPMLEATDVVGDLWSVRAYLSRCAPWLDPADVAALQRADAHAWTQADLPLLDAARRRLGDAQATQRARRREVALAAQRARMDDVVADLIATDDSEMAVMSMLRGADMKQRQVDDSALPTAQVDRLAGPFAHIVVDEAQELTEAQWQMLLARCPSRSMTIVGDRAQARAGFPETWQDRLRRAGLERIEVAHLSVNYRTPQPVMAAAEPVIRAALSDANVPTSVRPSDVPVVRRSVADLDALLARWLEEHDEGTACVITSNPIALTLPETPRVRALAPQLAKGLEFDLVILIDPQSFGPGVQGAVDRYVAMTRATNQLAILTSP